MGEAFEDEVGASYGDVVYVRIREAIATGRYEAGERLTEIALAAEFGTSRTPVREAMRRLESDGLVIRTGRGVVIPRLRLAEVVQLYQFRAALEALAAGLAAERVARGAIAAIDLDLLRQQARDFNKANAAGSETAMVRANRALHRTIADLSGNAFARDALLRIWDHVASVTRASDWVESIRVQHEALVDAIARGDATFAGEIARTHVEDVSAVYARRAARGSGP